LNLVFKSTEYPVFNGMIGKIQSLSKEYYINIDVQKYRKVLCLVKYSDHLTALLLKKYQEKGIKICFIDLSGYWSSHVIDDTNLLTVRIGFDLRFNPLLPPVDIPTNRHIDLLKHLIIMCQETMDVKVPSYWKLVFNQAMQYITRDTQDLTEMFNKLQDYVETASGLEKHCLTIIKDLLEGFFTSNDLSIFDNQEKLTLEIIASMFESYDGTVIDLSPVGNGETRALVASILLYYIMHSEEFSTKVVIVINNAESIFISSRSVNKLSPYSTEKFVVIISSYPEQIYQGIIEKADIVIGDTSFLKVLIKGLRRIDGYHKYFLYRNNYIIYFNKLNTTVKAREDYEEIELSEATTIDILDNYRDLAVSILRQLKEYGGMGIKGLIALNPKYGSSEVCRVVQALLSREYIRIKKVGREKIFAVSVKGLIYLKEAEKNAG